MKYLLMVLTLVCFGSCSSNKNDSNWDAGAQRQEAILDEGYNQQQETTRDQFPSTRSSVNEAQPF